MLVKKKRLFLSAAVSIALFGCGSTSELKDTEQPVPTGKKALNQPHLSKLDVVPNPLDSYVALSAKKDAPVYLEEREGSNSYVVLSAEEQAEKERILAKRKDKSSAPITVTKLGGSNNKSNVSATVQNASSEKNLNESNGTLSFDEFDKGELVPLETSHIANTAKIKVIESETFDFYLYETETYKDALSRWLYKGGYTKVGYLLGDLEDSILLQTVIKPETLHSTTENAIVHLIDLAKERYKDSLIKEEYEESISKSEEKEKEKEKGKDWKELPIYIDIRLNELDKQAIVTSSKIPTVMFIVDAGSLKANYKKLAEFYGWEAKDEFYLGKDYRISFGFPIVTEDGNIRDALSVLLAPFYDLRAAIVPTVRQVYVLQEKG